MKCNKCGAPMEELFMSVVCSKDCHKAPVRRVVSHEEAVAALREGRTIKCVVYSSLGNRRADYNKIFRYDPLSRALFYRSGNETPEQETEITFGSHVTADQHFKNLEAWPKDTQWEILT